MESLTTEHRLQEAVTALESHYHQRRLPPECAALASLEEKLRYANYSPGTGAVPKLVNTLSRKLHGLNLAITGAGAGLVRRLF